MMHQSSSKHEQVIVALCTGSNRAALALIRVCGIGAIELVQSVARVPGEKLLAEQPTHTVHYAQIFDGQTLVDQVMLFLMRAPKTFTGQDTVEITCHGNPLLVDQIIRLLLAKGARLAEGGEFSLRAVLNGKIDLVQAEAICELISANNQVALTQSMRKLNSGLSKEILELEKLILSLVVVMEASFEFLEEEERDVDFNQLVVNAWDALCARAKILQQSCASQATVNQGVKIALIGIPNAGKSTLFNRLVGFDRAIVNAQAGTTRDSIEHSMICDGELWSLIDTAGIRQTADQIELEGVQRALAAAQQADIIIFLLDFSQNLDPQWALLQQVQQASVAKVICVATKSDLHPATHRENLLAADVQLSAKTGAGIETLKNLLTKEVRTLFSAETSLFALNKRQLLLLQSFFMHLQKIGSLFDAVAPSEVIILELREMVQDLADLMGRDIQENVLQELFANFCVGK